MNEEEAIQAIIDRLDRIAIALEELARIDAEVKEQWKPGGYDDDWK